MKVKNINGTSTHNCRCGNWLEHWKEFGGQHIPEYCPVTGCFQKTEVGAHVQKDNSTDSNWYIIPLCRNHNAQTLGTINISDSVKLVSANVNETCGKV